MLFAIMHALVADVVWPALALEQRLLSILPVLSGLLFEALVLRYAFALTWRKAALVDLVMNAVSAAVGLLLLPSAGLATDRWLINHLSVATFDRTDWAIACLFAMFLSSGIETAVVRWMFRIPITVRRFWWIVFANAGSVAIAFVSLMLFPPHHGR